MRDWVEARARHRAMLVAVDFDGTLAPIVPHYRDATVVDGARAALETLAARSDTRVAIVSGRGLDDVRARVGLDALFYAGNHGLEIEGPGVHRVHADALGARPALEDCIVRLQDLTDAIDGLLLEDKGLTLSIHYRLVRDPERAALAVQEIRRRCGDQAALEITEGKKIVEIRPRVEWDKGRATAFLVEQLLPVGPVVFIGDDRTDEDAFRAIAGRGEGVVVGDPPPPDTAAASYVRSPIEVADLLGQLAGA
ncbi:MAG: trehalose-phosphatase [Longimicrobiales bacterium]